MAKECLYQLEFEKAKEEFLGKYFSFPNANLQIYKLIHIEPKYLLFEDEQGKPLLKELSKNVQWKDYYKELVQRQITSKFLNSERFKTVYDKIKPKEYYLMGFYEENHYSIHSLSHEEYNLKDQSIKDMPYIREVSFRDFYVPNCDFQYRYNLCYERMSDRFYFYCTKDHTLYSKKEFFAFYPNVISFRLDLNGLISKDDPEFCANSVMFLVEHAAKIRLYRKPF